MPPPDGVTLSASPTWEERPRAPLWELIKGVFWGEVLGSLVATGVLVLLWLPHLTTFHGRGDKLFWPWPVDGAWTLVGDLSWAIVVVALLAWAVQLNAGDRTDPRLSFMWTWIAVAAAGYTGMAVRVSGPVQALIAVLGGGVLLRVLGFKRSAPPDDGPSASPIRVLRPSCRSRCSWRSASASCIRSSSRAAAAVRPTSGARRTGPSRS